MRRKKEPFCFSSLSTKKAKFEIFYALLLLTFFSNLILFTALKIKNEDK